MPHLMPSDEDGGEPTPQLGVFSNGLAGEDTLVSASTAVYTPSVRGSRNSVSSSNGAGGALLMQLGDELMLSDDELGLGGTSWRVFVYECLTCEVFSPFLELCCVGDPMPWRVRTPSQAPSPSTHHQSVRRSRNSGVLE